MRVLSLKGAVRGKKCFTTVSDGSNPRPPDLVDRKFRASRPNQLWVADFTFVATWNGFVFVAFVIDVFARKIVGWRAAGSMKTDLVLDALEQALHERTDKDGLVHHSDRACNIFRFVTLRGWVSLESRRRSEPRATRMTTQWRNPSLACLRPKSFVGAVHGVTWRQWNSRPWNGLIGSITGGCSNPSATSRPEN